MKKVIAMAIALTVIGGAVCTNNNITRNCAATVYADETKAEATVKDGVKYDVYDDYAVATGYEKELKGDLVIPAKLGEVPVRAIASNAFKDCKEITSVTIPESVEYIGSAAFLNCSNLVSANIAGMIDTTNEKYIGKDPGFDYENPGIFCGCPKLEKISYSTDKVSKKLVSNLFHIEGDALAGYDADIYVFNEVENNSGTYHVVISFDNNDSSVNNGYAYGDLIPKSLKTIEITGGKNIDAGELEGLSTVENIILPDTIEFIGAYAFSGIDSLTAAKIPASVFYIGEGAFSECDNLVSVEFEGSYYKETDELKKYCESNDVDIDYLYPDTTWKGIFLYCPKLEKASCIAENDINMSRYFFNYGDYEISKNDTIPDDYMVVDYDYAADHRIDPFVIPKSFKTVSISGGETLSRIIFSNIKTLETISLPDSIKKIEHSAFYQCSNLKSIDIPESVTFIGDYAFSGCSSIEKLELPEKLETIGHGAFGSMDSLTSAKIPASVKTIGYNLFSACKNLRSLKIDGTPVISSKSETWIEYYDEMSGMVVYCPNFEKFETASDTFKWIDKEDVEHEITAKQAMFTYNENAYYEKKDMYTAEGDLLIPKSLKTGSSDKGDGKYGDANLDGNVDISDAVLIMQSISNPSKYQLSSAAKTLSDVTGNSDGVTNKDALAIQRYLLKLVDNLPE